MRQQLDYYPFLSTSKTDLSFQYNSFPFMARQLPNQLAFSNQSKLLHHSIRYILQTQKFYVANLFLHAAELKFDYWHNLKALAGRLTGAVTCVDDQPLARLRRTALSTTEAVEKKISFGNILLLTC